MIIPLFRGEPGRQLAKKVFNRLSFTLTFIGFTSKVETYSHIDTYKCTPLRSRERSGVA